MTKCLVRTIAFFAALAACAAAVSAQAYKRDLGAAAANLEIINNHGRVSVLVFPETEGRQASVSAASAISVAEREVAVTAIGGRTRIEVLPAAGGKRIDLEIFLPKRSSVRIRTDAGEVFVSGDLASVEVETGTGTIAADVPLDDVRYDFLWTASRPRFMSDVELSRVREKSAGRFVVSGSISRETPKSKGRELPEDKTEPVPEVPNDPVRLRFTTARGIILLNVNPNEVPADLRERPLTNAAKAVIRSGDSLLMEAIRRASPRYFGEYAATLPPLKFEPRLSQKTDGPREPGANLKRVIARVADPENRAVPDLKAADFQVLEAGTEREIVAVEPATAPFNLVLLLDVSGSVENYVDFIRKAARAFISTAGPDDRIAVVIFNEDVKTLSTFTTDKGRLSESLDTFDAGGGTAYYDAVAFTLADTLRPLRGDRTAVVVLTDGDDNKSFLPFEALLGSIQESGALIYPLYVPSSLIAASRLQGPGRPIDLVRTKFMGLTTKAEGEGERLARVSGGMYYPISQLSQIQQAYDDIILQLRTAYSITFRSDLRETADKTTASPRLRVRTKRGNNFVRLGSVVEVR